MDHGRGLSARECERVFEAYEATSTEAGGGTGLGLFRCVVFTRNKMSADAHHYCSFLTRRHHCRFSRSACAAATRTLRNVCIADDALQRTDAALLFCRRLLAPQSRARTVPAAM